MPITLLDCIALMRQKVVWGSVVVLLLLLSYVLGYWSGFTHAPRGGRVIVATDTSDSRQSSGKVRHEPYSTRQNAIPDKLQ